MDCRIWDVCFVLSYLGCCGSVFCSGIRSKIQLVLVQLVKVLRILFTGINFALGHFSIMTQNSIENLLGLIVENTGRASSFTIH
jgi:hypothetical protein